MGERLPSLMFTKGRRRELESTGRERGHIANATPQGELLYKEREGEIGEMSRRTHCIENRNFAVR